MIIEIFGPPGSGKTTFAHELARRLRREGYHAEVVLSYQPSTREGRFDLGIFLFISRIMAAVFSTSKILLSPRGRINLSTSLSMIRILPPKKRMWRARLWQYILKLSRCWDQAKQSRDVIIFDQGYVQVIGSLAMFNETADNVALAKALSLAPVADFTLRVVVPQMIVETRLLQRMMHEPPAERIFEADFDTNIRAFRVFQTINDILVQSNRKIIPIETLSNQSSLESIQSVEQKIISKILQTGGGPTAKRGQGHERLDADASDIDHRSDPKSTRVSAASIAPADIVLPTTKTWAGALATPASSLF
ncbi:AAA family ATPase [Mesorhizobium sp.]|uniref:AAA family ATPase n=1 Tax=Mesorhizobium sp. TaxID=1871066 RepID=UPI0025F534AD|nr:AAA family ATPase [Mesorhizobium sp.]